MATREIIWAFIFAASLNMVLTIEDADTEYQDEKDVRVVGRAYSLVGCDYENQAGYTCMSCHRALHCYIGGAAIMVDCYGLRRFCRDGRCSLKQGEKCSEDSKLTTAATQVLNVSTHTAEVGDTSNTALKSEATANYVK